MSDWLWADPARKLLFACCGILQTSYTLRLDLTTSDLTPLQQAFPLKRAAAARFFACNCVPCCCLLQV